MSEQPTERDGDIDQATGGSPVTPRIVGDDDKRAAWLLFDAVERHEQGKADAGALLEEYPAWHQVWTAAEANANGCGIKPALRAAINASGNPARFDAALKAAGHDLRESDDAVVAGLEGPRDVSAPTKWPPTDSGNAELFAHLNRDRVRFDHRSGRWLLWKEHHWAADDSGEVLRLAKDAARERFVRAASITDQKDYATEAKWAIASEHRHRITSCLALAQAHPPLAVGADAGRADAGRWDSNQWLLGVANGVVNLRTGMLRAGMQADFITLRTPIAFDRHAECPRWLKFLDETFGNRADNPDLHNFIHKAAGYSLSGDISEQVLFLCYGTGANGKTTFLEALRYAAGDYGHNLPFSALELQARAPIPSDVAALVGRRFVTSSETNEGARLNEARIKALTGGDAITARFLYSAEFTFRPVAKFWLATNHKPRVGDDSEGFWRRVRMIPFTRSFTGAAANKHLLDELRGEAAGILAWMVRGCVAWLDACHKDAGQAEGLAAPAEVREATESYRTEMDPLVSFLEDRCVVREGAWVPSDQLWEAYCEYSKGERGQPIRTRKGFAERLKAHRFKPGNLGGHDKTRIWNGLELAPRT